MPRRMKVIRCRFKSDNGYTVLLCDEIAKNGKAINCSIILVGYFLPDEKGDIFDAEVEEKSTKYGTQFSVIKYEIPEPDSHEAIEKLIVATKLRGIGKMKAKKLVKFYGLQTLDVLDNDFLRIKEIKGMPKDLETPQRQWKESRELRELFSLIGNKVNLSPKKLMTIRKTFKKDTMEIVKYKPYEIIKIKGIEFFTVDKIAKNCSSVYNINSIERIKAAILQALLDGTVAGHLYLRTNDLIKATYKLLGSTDISDTDIKKGINSLILDKQLSLIPFDSKNGDFAFYLMSTFNDEKNSAEKLVKMNFYSSKKSVDTDKVEELINKYEAKENIKLAHGQIDAVINAITKQVSIITGGAGRGKTTVLNMILDVYNDLFENSTIQLMAPTGRAARKMSEATGHDASTIHSALGLVSDSEMEDYGDETELEADLVIVDEMSMVDQAIFARLCSSLKNNCKLVMVGDKDQLSSVGAGNVFAELIKSEVIPTTILDTPFRQGENDLVFINAEKINKGDTNILEGVTFKFIECSGEEEIRDNCISVYKKAIKMNKGKLDNIFLLPAFRKNTEIGSNSLNNTLQKVINPNISTNKVEIFGKTFSIGDKVMQNKNINEEDISLSNGDIGYVTEINVGSNNDTSVTVDFEDVGIKEYSTSDDFEMLELAYATTVHKAQGSEAETVIIPMSNIYSVMLKRNLVYTAVSRAKRNVIVVGDKRAFYKAIKNTNYELRNTLLAWRIKNESRKYQKVEEKIEKKTEKSEYKQLTII